MNNDRRKRIEALRTQLEEISAAVDALRDEEQETFDNTPEGLQQTERGQASESAINELEAAQSSIDDAVSSLEECTQ